MKFLEKDLEDIIYEYPRQCYDRGLWLECCRAGGKMLRQVRLGRYGVADLVSVAFYDNKPGTVYDNTEGFCNKGLRIDIIECKKGQININTFLQAKRYEMGIRELLYKFDTRGVFVDVDLTLIGQTIDKSPDFRYAFQSTNTHAYTYSYGPDGIQFDGMPVLYDAGEGIDSYSAPEISERLKKELPVMFGFTQKLKRDLSVWQ